MKKTILITLIILIIIGTIIGGLIYAGILQVNINQQKETPDTNVTPEPEPPKQEEPLFLPKPVPQEPIEQNKTEEEPPPLPPLN